MRVLWEAGSSSSPMHPQTAQHPHLCPLCTSDGVSWSEEPPALGIYHTCQVCVGQQFCLLSPAHTLHALGTVKDQTEEYSTTTAVTNHLRLPKPGSQELPGLRHSCYSSITGKKTLSLCTSILSPPPRPFLQMKAFDALRPPCGHQPLERLVLLMGLLLGFHSQDVTAAASTQLMGRRGWVGWGPQAHSCRCGLHLGSVHRGGPCTVPG